MLKFDGSAGDGCLFRNGAAQTAVSAPLLQCQRIPASLSVGTLTDQSVLPK